MRRVSHATVIGAAFALGLSGFALAAEAIPRTPEGRPDLQGVWTNAALTNLERPPGVSRLVVTRAEAEAIVARATIGGVAPEDRDSASAAPEEGAPPAGAPDFGVRGYNSFWVDPGQFLAVVKGEIRSSYIVDPPEGRLPYRDRASIQKRRQAGFLRYVTGEGGNEGPEALTLPERCLIGFGNTGGPGMLSVLYNNTYQFVQTKDHFVILVEMNHDARIIPIGGRHRPSVMPFWLGDSVGRWERDTLVVETINVHPLQAAAASFFMTDKTTVTERFTRVSPTEIFYEFRVEDPSVYAQPWRAELSFHATKGPVFEYACHEGNYSMPGILAGARAKEKKAGK